MTVWGRFQRSLDVKMRKSRRREKTSSVDRQRPPSGGAAGSTGSVTARRIWAATAAPMLITILPRLEFLLKCSAIACAGLYVVLYLVIAALRIRYPFELEWIEGGMVEHVKRILAGQTVYVPPTVDFVPFIYPPLYYYVGAGLSLAMGVGLLPLRLISLASSLCCFGLLFFFVTRETKDVAAGTLAAGLFAATFHLSGAWFDLAHVDSLFLALLLAGFYLVRFGASVQSHVAAGLCFSLAFLTKQTAVVMSLPVVLYAVWRNRRLGLCTLATLLLCAGGATLGLNTLHGGWFTYYVFQLPSQHRLLPERWIGFWTHGILRTLWAACALGAIALARSAECERPSFWFLVSLMAGVLGGSWMSSMKQGAFDNVLMPAYAGLALLFGIATHVPPRRRDPEAHRPKERGRRGATRTVSARSNVLRFATPSGVLLLCIIQFALLAYSPLDQVPSRADESAGHEVLAAIAQIQGPVFMPAHGYLATLAGKRSYAHQAAVWDVYGGARNETRHRLAVELGSALRNRQFSALIMDGPDVLEPTLIERNYVQERSLFGSRDVFWPVTGQRTRPEIVYVPRR